MNSVNELKIGKWYQAQNRIFMPMKKVYDTVISQNFGRNPEFMLNMIYIQSVNHMEMLSFEYEQWEVFIEEDREFLFHVIGEDNIEIEDIKRPNKEIIRDIFKGIFSYKWTLHSGGASSATREMKEIIKLIKEKT